MKKMPAITFLSVLAILFFGFELCPAQAEEPGLLDGMKFEGSLTEDGSRAAPFEETLIFEKGEFLRRLVSNTALGSTLQGNQGGGQNQVERCSA